MIFRLRTFIRKRAVDTIVRPDPDPDQRHCYDDLKRNTGSRFVCLYPSDVTFYRRYCCGCCCYNCWFYPNSYYCCKINARKINSWWQRNFSCCQPFVDWNFYCEWDIHLNHGKQHSSNTGWPLPSMPAFTIVYASSSCNLGDCPPLLMNLILLAQSPRSGSRYLS